MDNEFTYNIQDVFCLFSSFHTADGSPEKTSRTNLLRTGTYDTNSRVIINFHCILLCVVFFEIKIRISS